MNKGREGAAWQGARRLAANIASGKTRLTDITSHALFFHATSVSPNWPGLVRTARIGNHIFYRRNPGWHGVGAAGRRTGRAIEVESRPRGGVLLPDGRIQTVIMPVTGPLDINVRPQMGDGV